MHTNWVHVRHGHPSSIRCKQRGKKKINSVGVLITCCTYTHSRSVAERKGFRWRMVYRHSRHMGAWEKQHEHNRKTLVRWEQSGFDSVGGCRVVVVVV